MLLINYPNGQLFYLLSHSQLSALSFHLQPLVPFFPKLPDQRPFQEFPKWNAFLFAFAFGRTTNAPFVIKDMGKTVFFNQTDRVEVTGNRFPEVAFSF